MAAQTGGDGSEDVTAFLARIKELGEKRDHEDAERTRKLQEEIAEGKRQRAARRAERERSLSPEKSSPVGSPRSPRTSRPLPNPELAAPVFSPSTVSRSHTSTPADQENEKSSPQVGPRSIPGPNMDEPQKPSPPPKPSSASSAVPTRSSTLSWQQRPPSVRGPRSRPFSVVDRPSPLRPAQEPQEKRQDSEQVISKDQIAQSLGSKDPAWFRQTADRGLNSRAYRKSSDSQASHESISTHKRALPGLSREGTSGAPSTLDNKSSKRPASASTSPDTSFERGAPPDESFVSANNADQGVFKMPSERPGWLERNAQEKEDGGGSSKTDKPSFGSGRAKYERSPSPTKGMGGFVESAMLKRSDSINKRWTAQPTTGLSRQDSNSRDRTARAFPPSSNSMPKLGETSREGSNEPNSRPGSSAGNAPVSRQESFSRATARQRSRPESRSSFRDPSPTKEDDIHGPPSPSKRFSPVKSSWLESALNKPEQPSPSHNPTTSQPSWMADLSRAKQQRSSRDQNQLPETETTPKPEASWKRKTVDLKTISDDEDSRSLEPRSKSPSKQLETGNTARFRDPVLPSQPTSSEELAEPSLPKIEAKGKTAEANLQAAATSQANDPEPVLTPAPRKPEAPPKKGIPTELKSTNGPATLPRDDGLEFQNVFGKLKRTKTQNYVAPDELKNNIMRGKAGLVETGGPQKTARRDELKEDLLKQKEVMKTRAAETPREAQPVRKSSKPVTPEAIVKKRALAQNASGGNVISTPTKSSTKADVHGNQNLEDGADVDSVDQKPGVKLDPTEAPPDQPPASSRFADRFNPLLANVLARGPATRPSVSSPANDTSLPTVRPPPKNDSSTSKGVSEPTQLQHMTKSRARGPKRRVPTTPASAVSDTAAPTSLLSSGQRSVSSLEPTSPSKPRDITPVPPSTAALTSFKDASTSPRSRPQAPPKSPDLGRKPSSDLRIPVQSNTALPTKPFIPPQQPSTRPITIKPIPIKPSSLNSSSAEDDAPSLSKVEAQASNQAEAPRVSVKNAMASWGKAQTAPTSPSVKQPIKLPSRQDQERADMPNSLGKAETAHAEAEPKPFDAGSEKPLAAPKPTPKAKPTSVREKATEVKSTHSTVSSSTVLPSAPQRSSSAQISEAEQHFASFFDETPIAPKELEVDTEKIISVEPRTATAKIKTLRKQINEISQDGKTTPLATGLEHVLFSNRMYVCTHVYGDASGARILEAYLWAGSHVADSSVDEAQLFAKKTAKDINGKLIIFRQGKESTHFLQALGGILITRRGSPTDSPTGYILCGRQHLGHLTFDEVTFSASSLCSGFPFIIVAGSDKVFLWKGLGCTTEELSGARLISMDLCPTGAVTELDEGAEPPVFLDVFSEKKPLPRSGDFWKHKPKHDNYRARLFNIEWHERPVSRHHSGPAQTLWGMVRRQSQPAPTHLRIDEITPFGQSDLESENIYVLDAFFEIYIIIGPLANGKSRAFASALVFAQEYGILAASSEHRPFVPVTSIVAEGAPKDMKAVFRTWDDALVSTNNLMTGKPKGAVGKGLKIVPLSAALAAVRVSS